MKNITKYLLACVLTLSIMSSGFAQSAVITDYHQTFFPYYNKDNQLRVTIRMYYLGNQLNFLVVNPYTFTTEIIPATNFEYNKLSKQKYTMQKLQETPYMQALMKYTSPPYLLANYGIIHANHPVDGQFLTVDMCPSKKPFEAEFFKTLVAIADETHQAFPVALSISGLWILGHPQDFAWLIEQEKANKLAITWTNHTFSHVYYPDLPVQNNFLLTPQTNINHEILDTEKLLLQHQQLPSVFFRFPGLISNKQLVLKLRDFGLIPIGSDAWLAKGQQPQNGSFILVHGNSNEHSGIVKVMPLLRTTHFLPLSQAF